MIPIWSCITDYWLNQPLYLWWASVPPHFQESILTWLAMFRVQIPGDPEVLWVSPFGWTWAALPMFLQNYILQWGC